MCVCVCVCVCVCPLSVGTVSGMQAIVAPSARSFMSKLVSAGDQGKALSISLSPSLPPSPSLSKLFYPPQDQCLHLLCQWNYWWQQEQLPSTPTSSQYYSATTSDQERSISSWLGYASCLLPCLCKLNSQNGVRVCVECIYTILTHLTNIFKKHESERQICVHKLFPLM